MPVRRIPMNYRHITGRIAGRGDTPTAEFEAGLERDFLTLLRFDFNVRTYEVQPVRIEYFDTEDRKHHYTPDVLVYYRTDITPAKWMNTTLFEIKHTDDLKKNAEKYALTFKAGEAYADEKGWDYKVITEQEIRTSYLVNARFLTRYLDHPIEDSEYRILVQTMRTLRQATPEVLLSAIYRDPWNQAKLLPSLWNLVARRVIQSDLTRPLTMTSDIWSSLP